MDYNTDERVKRVRAAQQRWLRTRGRPFDPAAHEKELWGIITLLREANPITERALALALNRYPRVGNQHFSKAQLVSGYDYFVAQGRLPSSGRRCAASR